MKTNKAVILLICFALLSVNCLGCVLAKGQENLIQEKQNSVYLFFAIAFLFSAATTLILYFKRNRELFIPSILSGFTILVYFMGSNVNSGDYGDGAVEEAKITAAIAYVCFLAQFVIWIMFRKNRRAKVS